MEEVRRSSIKIWTGLPEYFLNWKPDNEAMTCLEMVRHVLGSEHYYHLAIKNKGSLRNYESSFESVPLISVEKELESAQPFRNEFLETVKTYKEEGLSQRTIDRSNVGYVRGLGAILLRIAFHESVHIGQLLDYLRIAGVPRTYIWD